MQVRRASPERYDRPRNGARPRGGASRRAPRPTLSPGRRPTPLFQGREDDPRSAHGRVVDPQQLPPEQPPRPQPATPVARSRLDALPRRAPDDPLDWGRTKAVLADAQAALQRGDLSEADMIEQADAVWNSLPGDDPEQLLHRQLVTAEQYYAAEPADPREAQAWLARAQETGRLFDENSYGMQQYFLGPDERVYRRDPTVKPPKPLLDAYMMSSQLRHIARQTRNRRGVDERDPLIVRELLMEAYRQSTPFEPGE